MLRTYYLIIFEILVLVTGVGALVLIKKNVNSVDSNKTKELALFSFIERIIFIITPVLFMANLLIDLFISGSILPKLLLVYVLGIAISILMVMLYKNKNGLSNNNASEEIVKEKVNDIEEIEAKENIKIVEEIMSFTEESKAEESKEEITEKKIEENKDIKEDEDKEEKSEKTVDEDKEVIKKAAQLKAAKIAAAKKVQKEKAKKIEEAGIKKEN